MICGDNAGPRVGRGDNFADRLSGSTTTWAQSYPFNLTPAKDAVLSPTHEKIIAEAS